MDKTIKANAAGCVILKSITAAAISICIILWGFEKVESVQATFLKPHASCTTNFLTALNFWLQFYTTKRAGMYPRVSYSVNRILSIAPNYQTNQQKSFSA